MSYITAQADPPEDKFMTLQEIQLFMQQVSGFTGGEQFDAQPTVVADWKGRIKSMSVEVHG